MSRMFFCSCSISRRSAISRKNTARRASPMSSTSRLPERSRPNLVRGLILRFKPSTWTCCAVYRLDGDVSASSLGHAAKAESDAAGLRAALCFGAPVRLNLPAYPIGVWYFNPFAGIPVRVRAWFALGGAGSSMGLSVPSPFRAWCRLSSVCADHHDGDAVSGLRDLIPPMSTASSSQRQDEPRAVSADPFRRLRVPGRSASATRLGGPGVADISPCDQVWPQSLEVFCIGIYLSFIAHFIWSRYPARCGCSYWSASPELRS